MYSNTVVPLFRNKPPTKCSLVSILCSILFILKSTIEASFVLLSSGVSHATISGKRGEHFWGYNAPGPANVVDDTDYASDEDGAVANRYDGDDLKNTPISPFATEGHKQQGQSNEVLPRGKYIRLLNKSHSANVIFFACLQEQMTITYFDFSDDAVWK